MQDICEKRTDTNLTATSFTCAVISPDIECELFSALETVLMVVPASRATS